jgi:hypothetical protein
MGEEWASNEKYWLRVRMIVSGLLTSPWSFSNQERRSLEPTLLALNPSRGRTRSSPLCGRSQADS